MLHSIHEPTNIKGQEEVAREAQLLLQHTNGWISQLALILSEVFARLQPSKEFSG